MGFRPDLGGARLIDLQFEGGRLDLWVENVRVLGLSYAGPLHLHGVTGASSREPRCADDEFPLQAPVAIVGSAWRGSELRLDCRQPTGQGEADEPSYRIGFTRLENGLRPSLGLSLRSWAGFYPTTNDDKARYPGSRRVAIATLNGG